MLSNNLIIIGGGRQAIETYYLLEDLKFASNLIAFVQDKVEAGKEIMGKPIISKNDILTQYQQSKKPLLLGAIGNIPANKN